MVKNRNTRRIAKIIIMTKICIKNHDFILIIFIHTNDQNHYVH